ncbi:MAG: recombinase family protein [Potamolinea sp.]
MSLESIWITGSSRSGKTTKLVTLFRQWVGDELLQSKQSYRSVSGRTWHDRRKVPAMLILAANDDNRRDFAEKLTMAIQGRYPILSKTPLGFFQDEVMLFWPLLIQRLNLRAQFPLRLRPETEEELATHLWRKELDQGLVKLPGANESARVRRLLDLLQLAAVSGIPIEDIPTILLQGMPEEEGTPELWECMGKLLLDWRGWCLERGLLTYGIICDLYGRYLLPDETYQQHLQQRYQAVLADDVDDYPAIARDLFECLLDRGAVGAFTYNPDGKVRLGLNADPHYLEGLAARCQVETLTPLPNCSLADSLGEVIVEIVSESMFMPTIPQSVQSIITISRAQLLRQTAQVIIEGVKSGKVQPQEIAIIAPGLDAIARYTLTEILSREGIAVAPLNDQRPLVSSPLIRGLLTLLALVYPGLGRLVDRDAVAEMLVVLSQKQEDLATFRDGAPNPPESYQGGNSPSPIQTSHIDPVRAGLLADHCYSPDQENPRLLSVESFPRWDRLGHRASSAYLDIVQWLEVQRAQQEQRLIPSCVVVLDRAIQKFLWNGSQLPYDQLSALRELMETAQHYWEVDGRLRVDLKVSRLKVVSLAASKDKLQPVKEPSANQTIAQFIQMLRRGAITANPYPVRRVAPAAVNAVTMATIFQYRANRSFHRWHFWLDASSSLWLSGGAATLFGANLFLKEWSGRPWTEEDKIKADNDRLQRILRDLLGRAGEQVYLCHSELAVNGTDQNGPLLNLVHASLPLA